MEINSKKIKKDHNNHNKQAEIQYNFEKRAIVSLIEQIKSKNRAIKTFEFIPTKEQLFDVCERIDTDIKEIKDEISVLNIINDEVIKYTESQIEVLRYLRKNIHATRLMYSLINKSKIFGKLNKVDMQVFKDDDKCLEEEDKSEKSPKSVKSFDVKTKTNDSSCDEPSISKAKKQTIVDEINSQNNIEDNIHIPKKEKSQNTNKTNNLTNKNTNKNSEDEAEDKCLLPNKDFILKYNVQSEDIKNHFQYLFLDKNDSRKKSQNLGKHLLNRKSSNTKSRKNLTNKTID